MNYDYLFTRINRASLLKAINEVIARWEGVLTAEEDNVGLGCDGIRVTFPLADGEQYIFIWKDQSNSRHWNLVRSGMGDIHWWMMTALLQGLSRKLGCRIADDGNGFSSPYYTTWTDEETSTFTKYTAKMHQAGYVAETANFYKPMFHSSMLKWF